MARHLITSALPYINGIKHLGNMVGSMLPVDEFCAQAHDAQKAVYDGFDLAFYYFGRSSSPQNREITQEIARDLKANGFIEERAIRQVYSNADGRFLPDRYIIG